jgi:hypothetical protein
VEGGEGEGAIITSQDLPEDRTLLKNLPNQVALGRNVTDPHCESVLVFPATFAAHIRLHTFLHKSNFRSGAQICTLCTSPPESKCFAHSKLFFAETFSNLHAQLTPQLCNLSSSRDSSASIFTSRFFSSERTHLGPDLNSKIFNVWFQIRGVI